MATSQPPNQVEMMHKRMLHLRDNLSLSEVDHPAALDETFEAFGVTLEELRVAEEHLIHTNNLLLTTRHQLDSERRRYRELFDQAPDGYLVTDADGLILDANLAASALFNVPQRFIVGKVLANFVLEPERRAFRLALADAGVVPGPARWQLHLRPRHGELIEVEVSVSSAANPSGKARDLLWLFRDLTGRDRQTEPTDPTAERDRLRDLIDSVGVVVWEADPETARLTFVSREIEAYLGRPAETWLDAPDGWTGHVHPDDSTVLTALRARQIADRTDLELEYRLVAPDGRSVWVREISRFSPEPVTLRGVLINVHKRKRNERRLHYARTDVETQVRDLSFLQDLCERLSHSIDLTDVLGEIVSAVISILGSEMGSIALLDPARDELRIAASAGLSPEFLQAMTADRPGESPSNRALSERQSVSIADLDTDVEPATNLDLYRARGIRALFASPLLSHSGQAIGVVSVYFPEPHRPAERQQALVELYARQAGQILANARRIADLLNNCREWESPRPL